MKFIARCVFLLALAEFAGRVGGLLVAQAREIAGCEFEGHADGGRVSEGMSKPGIEPDESEL